MVVADDAVDGCVELDTRNFSPAEGPPLIDIVNHVSRNRAKNGTEAADDPRLFAVGDVVVADEVATDRLFGPTLLHGPLDGIVVGISRIFSRYIFRIVVFPKSDPGADGIADRVVFDDPAFRPMRADQADLLGGGRRPGCCSMLEGKSAQGNVVQTRLFRVEDRLPRIDFSQFLVGIDPLELRPDGCI